MQKSNLNTCDQNFQFETKNLLKIVYGLALTEESWSLECGKRRVIGSHTGSGDRLFINTDFFADYNDREGKLRQKVYIRLYK